MHQPRYRQPDYRSCGLLSRRPVVFACGPCFVVEHRFQPNESGQTNFKSVRSKSYSPVHPPQCCPPSAVLLRRTGYGGRASIRLPVCCCLRRTIFTERTHIVSFGSRAIAAAYAAFPPRCGAKRTYFKCPRFSFFVKTPPNPAKSRLIQADPAKKIHSPPFPHPPSPEISAFCPPNFSFSLGRPAKSDQVRPWKFGRHGKMPVKKHKNTEAHGKTHTNTSKKIKNNAENIMPPHPQNHPSYSSHWSHRSPDSLRQAWGVHPIHFSARKRYSFGDESIFKIEARLPMD